MDVGPLPVLDSEQLMPAPATARTRARRAPVSHGARALHVGVLFLALTAVCGSAWSSWSSIGGGSGGATTNTLGAPASVAASTTTGTSNVSVSWIAAATGVAPTGYRVRRTNVATGEVTDACGTSVSSLLVTRSCTDGGLADGTYRYGVVAVRSGWSAASAASQPVTVIGSVATSISVASSNNPSVVGQSITYTATVTAESGTPTGSVVFTVDGTTVACSGGTQALTSGTATCVVSHPSPGARSVAAAYAGSAPYAASSSAPLTQVVDAARTRTVVTSSANPSVAGQEVTYTAAVSAVSPGSGVPAGTVTFADGTTTIACTGGNQTLSSGTATCSVSHAAASARSITATYAGSPGFQASTSAVLSQVVHQAATTTTVTSSTPTVRPGQTVTFTAAVAANAPGAGVPTGTVAFKDGSSTISCAAGSQSLNTSGTATCTTTFLTSGTRSVTATYAGSSSYSTSVSTALSQGVRESAAGLVFSNVKVGSTSVTPVCIGTPGTSYSCTVVGPQNGVVSAQVGFGTGLGAPVAYGPEDQSIAWTVTGKTPGSGMVTVHANATTSATTLAATKSGVNAASITVTFTEPGGTTWSAALTLS